MNSDAAIEISRSITPVSDRTAHDEDGQPGYERISPEDEDNLYAEKFPRIGSYTGGRMTAMEFDLSTLPAAPEITSAFLQIRAGAFGPGSTIEIPVFSYTGDGQVTESDMLSGSPVGAMTFQRFGSAFQSISVKLAINRLVSEGRRYAGFRLSGPTGFSGVLRLFSKESSSSPILLFRLKHPDVRITNALIVGEQRKNIQLTFSGFATFAYTLQQSVDFGKWTDIQTQRLNTDGPDQFTIPVAGTLSFLRVRVEQ